MSNLKNDRHYQICKVLNDNAYHVTLPEGCRMTPSFNSADLICYEGPTLPPFSLPDPDIILSDPPDIPPTIVDSMTVNTRTDLLQRFLFSGWVEMIRIISGFLRLHCRYWIRFFCSAIGLFLCIRVLPQQGRMIYLYIPCQVKGPK